LPTRCAGIGGREGQAESNRDAEAISDFKQGALSGLLAAFPHRRHEAQSGCHLPEFWLGWLG
jgi:hypothetical protein